MSQFGDSAEGVDPGAVDKWLGASGTLEFDPPRLDAFEGGDSSSRRFGLGSGGGDGEGHVDGEEGEGAARYDCGLDGCKKAFAHNHFLAAGGGGLPPGFDERLWYFFDVAMTVIVVVAVAVAKVCVFFLCRLTVVFLL